MGGSTEQLLTEIYGAINAGDLEAIDRLFAEDFVDHGEGDGGRDALKQQVAAFRVAFPDLHVQVDEVVADGDRYGCRTTVTGTHQGDLMGMPATGRSVRVTSVDLGHIRDGRAAERWGGLDTFALLTQLGAIPAPQAA